MISRITLMTPTLFAPKLVMVTVNSVCSSAAGAAAAAAPPAATIATGAAAVTPNLSSIIFTRSTISITVMLEIASRISSLLAAIVVTPEK